MLLQQLSERIFVLPYTEPTDRPNLFYIRGDEYAVAIDAGNSAAHAALFAEGLRQRDLPLPRYTVLTHWHWDHTFAMHALKSTTIASRLTDEKLRQVQKWRWTPEDLRLREQTGEDIPFCTKHIVREYPDLRKITVVPADEVVEDLRVLDLGGVHLELIARDSPHSRDALFIRIPEENALFVSDADCPDFYDNNDRYDKARLESLIAFLRATPYCRHFLGHAEEETKRDALARLEGCLSELN